MSMSHQRRRPRRNGSRTRGDASRAGFSLVELTIVVLLGTLLVAASYQVLVTNQRTYTVNSARIQAQQTVRSGLYVLTSEFREVSAAGGDILALDDDTLRVRAMRGAGIVCLLDIPGNRMMISPMGRGLSSADSIYLFADNGVDRRDDDVWLRGSVGTVAPDATCPNGPTGAQTVALPGWNSALNANTVRIGAPVRSFRHYTYGAMVFDGETYLGRVSPGLAAQPLVGPLRAGTGLLFTYFDSLDADTDVPADVRRIRVTLRTPETAQGTSGHPVADSVTAWIYTRN